MSSRHNKKRNVGIIFEQLVKYMSTSLLENKRSDAADALAIIREHFQPGSELYREFRLFNALIKTRVSNESLANRILEDSRHASRSFDSVKLRKEKSGLIKKINHVLDEPSFYNIKIKEYRDYATIQTLLNDWRNESNDRVAEIAIYENKVLNWLLSEKQNTEKVQRDVDVDSLAVKIMTEKLNRKYSSRLNYEQRQIIKEYIFSLEENNKAYFRKRLADIKNDTLKEINEYSSTCTNQVLNEKMKNVIKNISSMSITEINDDTITKVLTLSRLRQEILESNDG